MFRLMIIQNNRSEVRDDPSPLVHLSSLEVDMDRSEVCLFIQSGGHGDQGGHLLFIIILQSSS